MKTIHLLPLLLSVILIVCTGCGNQDVPITTDGNVRQMDYSWLQEHHVIAHAFGGIDEYTYTNSLEAFEANYAAGFRVFEADFMLTTENIAVAGHDWAHFYSITGRTWDSPEEAPALSLEEFRSSRIFEKFTPMTWTEIATLMSKHPDMYIVTDTKHTADPMITTTFTQMVTEAQKIDPAILDRIIPQIYNNEMYDIIYEVYPWKSVIYTTYNQADEFSYDNVYKFCASRGIKAIATFPARSDADFTRKVHRMGGYMLMYTFNDKKQVTDHIDSHDIRAVYTDFLLPEELEPLFE
ncbi:MAG: hypothetical protein IKL04_06405 [Lachnospiraceae bacterium]|nr:hypothetical protein [Lachnospiraceae bacterium]